MLATEANVTTTASGESQFYKASTYNRISSKDKFVVLVEPLHTIEEEEKSLTKIKSSTSTLTRPG